MTSARNLAIALAFNTAIFLMINVTIKTQATQPRSIIPVEFFTISAPDSKKPVVKPQRGDKPVSKAESKPEIKKQKIPEPEASKPALLPDIVTESAKQVKTRAVEEEITEESPERQEPELTRSAMRYTESSALSVSPSFSKKVTPAYPPLALRVGKEGTAVVVVWLEPDGSVTKAVLTENPGWGFGEAALKAATSSVFNPGRRHGEKVRSRLRIPYRFRLR